MRLYALISDENLVAGIVQTPSEAQVEMLADVYAQVIDVTDFQPMPQIGWSFDGQQVVGTSPSKKITRLAMRQRFTVTELLGIMTYVNANPASIIAMLMQNLQVSTFVDLARSDTIAGVSLLASAPFNLITSERASQILNNPVGPLEVYVP